MAGKGKRFRFHGSFSSKSDAQRKERQVSNSFIKKIHSKRMGTRYLVLTERKR